MNSVLRNIHIVLFSLLLSTGYTQVPEIGIMGGGSYYIGDLNPTKHFYKTKFAAGVFYRNQIRGSDRLSWRLNINYGRVEAYDADSPLENNINRNLDFRSTILEIGPILEINYLKHEVGSDRFRGTPYLFIGLNYFKMNPQGSYLEGWVDLRPLATEGQGTSLSDEKPYRLNQISIPLGLGIKMNLGSRLCLGLEYGIRKTFTDHLDDVSGRYINPALLSETSGALSAEMSDKSIEKRGIFNSNTGQMRGNDRNTDWYTFFGATLSFRLFENTTCTNSFGRH